jgi:hypothetical protein
LTQTRARRIAHDAFNPVDNRFHLDGEPPINFLLASNANLSTIPVSTDPLLCEHFTGFHKKSHDDYVDFAACKICYKDALIDPTIVYQFACHGSFNDSILFSHIKKCHETDFLRNRMTVKIRNFRI